MSGLITTVQESAVHIFESDPYFARISIIPEQSHDIATILRTALSKLGICIVVTTPKATCSCPNAPGPVLDPLELSIDIIEQVLLNRAESGSRLPASEVAERTAWLLHFPNHAHHRSDPYPLTAKKFYIVPDDHFQIFRVEFTTNGALAGITE